MQIQGFSKASLREAMEDETGFKKCSIAIVSLVQFSFAFIIATFYTAWWANQH